MAAAEVERTLADEGAVKPRARSATALRRGSLVRRLLAKRISEKWPSGGIGAALDQAHAVRRARPSARSVPRKLGAPAELARRRRKQVLQGAPRTLLPRRRG